MTVYSALGIPIKVAVAVFDLIADETVLYDVFRNFPLALYNSTVSNPVLFFKPETVTTRFEFWANP
jgi:hypothetical protein